MECLMRYSATVLQLVFEVSISRCSIYKISNYQIFDKLNYYSRF